MLTAGVLLLAPIAKCSLKYDQKKIMDENTLYLFIIFIIFTLTMGFRGEMVGLDTSPYSRIYEIIGTSASFGEAAERTSISAPLYILLSRIFYLISKDAQVFVFFTSCLINVALVFFIKKTSKNVAISAFTWIGLLLFYDSMNGTRQCMALVLAMNAIVYFSESLRNKKAWILIALAIGIHSTSAVIVVVVLGFLLAEKIKKNRTIFFASIIFSVLISLGLHLIIILFARLFPRYSLYTFENSRISAFASSGGGRIIYLYIFLLMLTILWLLKPYVDETVQDKFINKLMPALIFCSVIGIMNSRNILLNRMLWYLIALFIIFIPALIDRYKGIFKYLLMSGIILVLFVYSYISLIENKNGVVPYSFFWS